MSDETPTVTCLCCRYAIAAGGVTGFSQPLRCPRCDCVHRVTADGERVYRVRVDYEASGLLPRGTQ